MPPTADVRVVLDAIAATLPLPDRGRALLAGPVRGALAAGWQPGVLGAHLVDRVTTITTTTEALMRYRLRVLPETPAVCPCAACRRHVAAAEAAVRQDADRRARDRAAEHHQAAVVDAEAVAARHDALDADLGPVLHGRIVQAALAARPILRSRQLSAARIRTLAASVYTDHGHDSAAIRAYAEGLPPAPSETTTATQTAPDATDSTSPTRPIRMAPSGRLWPR